MPKTKKTTCCQGLKDLIDIKFFKALGDPNRVSLLVTLAQCQKACSVTELTSCCDVDVSVVSRHLSILHNAGIVKSQKQGKQVLYSVRIKDLVKQLRTLASCLAEASS